MDIMLIVAAVFTDPRWKPVGRFLRFADIDGTRFGAVLATYNVDFDSYALNKAAYERVADGKRTSKIDHGYVVATTFNGSRQAEYVAGKEAVEFFEKVLRAQPLKTGRFGEFWSLTPYDFGVDAPF